MIHHLDGWMDGWMDGWILQPCVLSHNTHPPLPPPSLLFPASLIRSLPPPSLLLAASPAQGTNGELKLLSRDEIAASFEQEHANTIIDSGSPASASHFAAPTSCHDPSKCIVNAHMDRSCRAWASEAVVVGILEDFIFLFLHNHSIRIRNQKYFLGAVPLLLLFMK